MTTHTGVVYPDGSGRVRIIRVAHSAGDDPQTPDEQLILQLQAENVALRIQVRQADERGDEAMRRAHAAEAENEALAKQLGECSGGYQTLEKEFKALKEQNAEWLKENAPGGWIDALRKEIHYLRLYGNKDCTAQADAAMKGKT